MVGWHDGDVCGDAWEGGFVETASEFGDSFAGLEYEFGAWCAEGYYDFGLDDFDLFCQEGGGLFDLFGCWGCVVGWSHFEDIGDVDLFA